MAAAAAVVVVIVFGFLLRVEIESKEPCVRDDGVATRERENKRESVTNSFQSRLEKSKKGCVHTSLISGTTSPLTDTIVQYYIRSKVLYSPLALYIPTYI